MINAVIPSRFMKLTYLIEAEFPNQIISSKREVAVKYSKSSTRFNVFTIVTCPHCKIEIGLFWLD